jgi:ClpP class serine protease
MPNWNEVQQQITQIQAQAQAQGQNALNIVRSHFLQLLHQKTGRNIIAYYSGFLSKPGIAGMEINDEDKNGFMMAVHRLDRTKGLDLFLHTPGGSISSTQSIVDYLHKMFGKDIRAIIPQIAMSAGTMIACSCREIWMGKHSNLGPIDPQVNNIPAYGVLKEFKRACKEVKDDRAKIPIWQSIIGQYRPTFLSRCENAIEWSNDFVKEQLVNVMFEGDAQAKKKAARVVKGLAHYKKNKTHEKHLHFEECDEIGLKVYQEG